MSVDGTPMLLDNILRHSISVEIVGGEETPPLTQSLFNPLKMFQCNVLLQFHHGFRYKKVEFSVRNRCYNLTKYPVVPP